MKWARGAGPPSGGGGGRKQAGSGGGMHCVNATSVNMFKDRIDQYFLKTRRE